MRVLLVNTVFGIGSTGKICQNLYDELERQGNECWAAYGRGTAPQNYKTYRIGNRLSVYEHVLETRLFDNHGEASRHATKKFIQFIEELDPDIIHLHNIHGYYLNYRILFDYLKDSRAKIIWTLHDAWPITGHSAFFDSDNSESQNKFEYPKTIGISRNKKNKINKESYFLKVPEMIIVTPSKWLQRIIKKSFLNKYRIVNIYNGIDEHIFKPTAEINTDKKIILGVANIWEERKGLNYFLNLADLITQDFEIYLVGRISKTDLRLLNSKHNIFHINQTTNQEELASLYRTSYVFVNPTEKDNFPTTNIEAVLSGTPVIGFDTGGNREIINDKTGILLGQKNSDSIWKAVKQIHRNFDPPVSKFSKRAMIDNYLNLYAKF